MILKGQHGTYQRGKRIGGGGNGSVYQVSYQPPTQKECVVKILRVPKRGGQKSYQRFIYEITAMKELSGKYESFLPVLDEYLPDELKGDNPPWYLMPRAIPLIDYVFGKNMLVTQKMMIAKELAITLADIHREGYSHRDIKPENILYYKNRLVVSDFGLVSHSKFERVTGHKERIGPWNTIAPEMRRFPDQIADARPADVYSFAKTVNRVKQHVGRRVAVCAVVFEYVQASVLPFDRGLRSDRRPTCSGGCPKIRPSLRFALLFGRRMLV